jgi:hypothetical protein
MAMIEAIKAELKRVVGPSGVTAMLDSSCDPPVVRVEIAEAVWGMEPAAFLELLKNLPDRAGVLPLRQAVDSHPAKLSYDDCPTIR